MGQWAIEHLETAILPRERRYQITKLECSLVKRASVAAPAGVHAIAGARAANRRARKV